MQAITFTRYGSPDVLTLTDVDIPEVGEDGIVIRVRAASINAVDWHFMRGEPMPARMGNGLRRPKDTSLGVDLAGEVEAVGPAVEELKPGDEVYGVRWGAFAEQVRATSASSLVPKPANLTFEQAAAVPTGGLTALQGLRDHGHLRAGQRVLINGASGGVGTFAVQIAKTLGAYVTGICSTTKVELVRSLGADQVIDYTADDFLKTDERYDLILDIAGSRSLRACRKILTTGGILVVVGGPAGRWIRPVDRMLKAVVLSRFGSKRMVAFVARPNKEDLLVLKDMIEAGTVTPVVERTYPLSKIAEAMRYVEEGHARGKVILTV